ncbi:hypothetical protein SMU95_01450 [Streptococcus mutans B]|jgi:hypothetical protein|nr:hypothetical protein SMU41_01260 [Streptococcus mutans 2VS1]EMB94033.1 hypothetical protein SMU61_06946 [Streptococcus mutans G123]EMC04449.1 hypothetical protein SMU69_08010 [Streptococcus mutans NLML4]EMC07908.1 hypothetical protein SMU72_07609 [Streptococcus mutans NLML9]EMC41058.1 hypothetical protein SMU95_01450 [Streptococcus mutans B]BAH88858.1 hypothetical protein SmuNN2025_1832 [Streptococcus mutans NN2025]
MEVTRLRKAPKNHILFFKGDNRYRLSGYVKLEDTDSSGSFLYTDYMKHNTMFPYGGMFLKKFMIFQQELLLILNTFIFLLIYMSPLWLLTANK